MSGDPRREEFGKFFLDLSKYVLTVVVIGTLVSDVVDLRALLVGLVIGVTFAGVGYWILPPTAD